MPRIFRDRGKSEVSPLKTFTITPPTPRETLLSTPLILPTTEPATGQFSFTIQESDLPSINPKVPMKYNAVIYTSGKVGVAASTISYRILKNGVSVATQTLGSSTAANFWMHSHFRTFDVQLGDVLEVRYWAAQADVNLDYYGLSVFPTMAQASKDGTILKDVYYGGAGGIISPITLSATVFTLSFSWTYATFPTTNNQYNISQSVPLTYPSILYKSANGLYRLNIGGDLSPLSTTALVHATQRQYHNSRYPTIITFREMLR